MSVFGFFVFECFNQLSDLFYPSSRGKQKNKQSSSNKAAEKMYMLQSIDTSKKSRNPIKTRNVRGQLLFHKRLHSPVAADNRGQQGLRIDAIWCSQSIRGHPRTTKQLRNIPCRGQPRTSTNISLKAADNRGQTADKAFTRKNHFPMIHPCAATLKLFF